MQIKSSLVWKEKIANGTAYPSSTLQQLQVLIVGMLDIFMRSCRIKNAGTK
jgi:hypothetical protein